MADRYPVPCMSEVRGCADAVRRVVRAIARGHHVLLQGPPSPIATMIARRIPGILPPLDDHARRWLAAEYEPLWRYPTEATVKRPMRAPHYTVSTAALAGSASGHVRHACEARLARFGVLLLDDLPEFHPDSVEALRGTLRAMGRTAPVIVATAMECPCGYHGVGPHSPRCDCSPAARGRYLGRVVAMTDRLRLRWDRIALPHVPLRALRDDERAPTSAECRAAIEAAL